MLVCTFLTVKRERPYAAQLCTTFNHTLIVPMTHAFQHTEGIIVKVIPFRDNDVILSLFTPAHGLIKLIHKWSKRTWSPLIRVEAVYKEGTSDLFLCKELTHLDSFLHLKQDLRHLECACDLLRQIETSQLAGIESGPLYQLLNVFLERIPQAADPAILPLCFRLKLLIYEGLLSFPMSCSLCDLQLHQEAFALQGDYYCRHHAPPDAIALDEDELQLSEAIASFRRFSDFAALSLPDIAKKEMVAFFCG